MAYPIKCIGQESGIVKLKKYDLIGISDFSCKIKTNTIY